MNKIKSAVAGAMVVALLGGAVYVVPAVAETDSVLDIWSTYNTKKVLRDETGYERLEGPLSIAMAKNETEGAQLVLTAKADVGAFSVSVSDLVCGNEKIGSEAVDVYVQQYADVVMKTNNSANPDFPTGYTPDGMLPMSIVEKYGENKISRGQNQGITLEVTTTEETAAGDYTGTVFVSADGKSYSVPIVVTVWDIVLQSNSRSVFASYLKNYMFGEMDASMTTQEAYYEMMLDYKICNYFVPGTEVSPEVMIEHLDQYWEHPNFTTYSLPSINGYGSNTVHIRYYKQYLKAIAEHCTPQRNYLERAVNYVLPCDEPWADNAMQTVVSQVAALQEAGEAVITELRNENFYAQFASEATAFQTGLESAIRNIQHIITDEYRDIYADSDITFCPTFDKFASETGVQNIAEHALQHENEMWWYGCVNPKYPYPTYHIDDSLVGARAVGWMQKQYNVVGNLFWCVNAYQQWFTDVGIDTPVDPYQEINRIGVSYRADANGDGFLFYPGKKYGSDKPFPSLRLMTIRDGNDDYDLLCELEKTYEELEDYYRVEPGTFALENTLQKVFDSIGMNVEYFSDESNIYEARKIVAELIGLARSDAKFVVYGGAIKNGEIVYRMYAADSFTVQVNGEAVGGAEQGEGTSYRYTQKLDRDENYLSVRLACGDTIYEYSAWSGGKVFRAIDFGTGSVSGISATEGMTFAANAVERTLDFTVVSQGDRLAELMSFRPALTIEKAALGIGDMTQVDTISFTIRNDSDTDSKVVIRLLSASSQFDLKTISLPAHSEAEVTVEKAGCRNWAGYAQVTGMAFVFENINGLNEKLPDRAFRLGEIYISMRGV